MNQKLVHIPFYVSDWLASTAGLSDAEKGVYITLISLIYDAAGPIKRDDKRLWRLAGSRSKAAFVKILDHLIEAKKIIESDSLLHNQRAQKEIYKVLEKCAKNSQAAKERWRKNSSKISDQETDNQDLSHMNEICQKDADAMRTHSKRICQPDPEPDPEPEKLDEKSPGGREPVSVSRLKQPLSHLPEDALDQCLKAAGLDRNALAGSAGLANFSMIANLTRPPPPGIAQAPPCDFTLDVLPAVQACAASLAARGETMQSWKYCHRAILKTRDQRLTPIPKMERHDDPNPGKRPTPQRSHKSGRMAKSATPAGDYVREMEEDALRGADQSWAHPDAIEGDYRICEPNAVAALTPQSG